MSICCNPANIPPLYEHEDRPLDAVSQGKIAEISAYWIPSEGIVKTPWASGTVPVRD
jgi:hypothetical protein